VHDAHAFLQVSSDGGRFGHGLGSVFEVAVDSDVDVTMFWGGTCRYNVVSCLYIPQSIPQPHLCLHMFYVSLDLSTVLSITGVKLYKNA
jgi:hypothetical protein